MSEVLTPILVGSGVIAWAVAFVTSSPAVAVLAAMLNAAALGSFGMAVHERRASVGERTAQPVEQPVEVRRPAEPRPLEFTAPHSLGPTGVVRALITNGRMIGNVVAAHLWIAEESTGTLRIVAADGPMTPSTTPVPLTDPILGVAISSNSNQLASVQQLTSPSDVRTVWRYAIPIEFEKTQAVAAIDISSGREPDRAALDQLAATLAMPLLCAVALHLAQARTAAARHLIDTSRDLSKTLDADTVVADSLRRAMELADAATGSIMLLDEDLGVMTIAAAEGLPADVVGSTTVSLGEGIAGWVAASGQPLLVEDLPGKTTRGQRHGVRSAVCVPISDEQGLIGVINVGSRKFPARFTENHLETLEILARQTAVALRNARAVASAGELYFDTLKALALALETKDPYATGGTERIMEYATALGKAMDLDADDQRALEVAAMLHDIGMSAIGEAGAASARPLSTVERGLLKMHPVIAADILDQAPALKAVTPIVYHHHEHFDGRGYVSGLSGEEIPLGARILSVADAYVAMTSDRPYRKAMPSAQAALELDERAGTQFDPDVVRVFLDLLDRGNDRVPDRKP